MLLDCCPVCGGSRLAEFARLDHRRLARCRGCGHRFAAEFSEAELERHYRESYYPAAADPRIAEWALTHGAVWRGLVRTLLESRPDPRSLLDVGAGSGGFLEEFRRQCPGAALSAVESSPAAREALARRFPGLRFPAARLEDLDRDPGPYEAVTILQTLEHAADPARLCREARRLLAPGGVLLLTVPNRHYLGLLLRGKKRSLCYANATHLQFFGRFSLERILSVAGFRAARRVVDFGGGPGGRLAAPPRWLLRLLGLSSELRYLAWGAAEQS